MEPYGKARQAPYKSVVNPTWPCIEYRSLSAAIMCLEDRLSGEHEIDGLMQD